MPGDVWRSLSSKDQHILDMLDDSTKAKIMTALTSPRSPTPSTNTRSSITPPIQEQRNVSLADIAIHLLESSPPDGEEITQLSGDTPSTLTEATPEEGQARLANATKTEIDALRLVIQRAFCLKHYLDRPKAKDHLRTHRKSECSMMYNGNHWS